DHCGGRCGRGGQGAGAVGREALRRHAEAGGEARPRDEAAGQGEPEDHEHDAWAAHGPVRTRSTSSTWPRAMALARVTVTEPPPAGTVALPLLEVVPLLRVAWSAAPPQPEGRLLTVTPTTFEPDRTC